MIIAMILAGATFALGQTSLAEQHGVASYYTVKSNGGTRTASGKPLSDTKPSAAHRTLPFGTLVRVTHLRTGRSVTVPITDRGPYVKGRVIDLSAAAARRLGVTPRHGIARVSIKVVKRGKSNR